MEPATSETRYCIPGSLYETFAPSLTKWLEYLIFCLLLLYLTAGYKHISEPNSKSFAPKMGVQSVFKVSSPRPPGKFLGMEMRHSERQQKNRLVFILMPKRSLHLRPEW